MTKGSWFWAVVLICIVTISVISSGCSKKQMVKEEAAGKPSMEAKKAAPPPAPKMEQPKTPPAPKMEVKSAPKAEAAVPIPSDITGMRLQFAFDDYSLSTRSQENLEKIALVAEE